uniref:Uncharacterized protein n=1 Tax=Schlesneria paludicola TaxID=360056 RepID=A0A7C4LJJ9_9PLAN
MNESPIAAPPQDTLSRWLLVLGFAGVVVGVLLGRPLLELVRTRHEPSSPPQLRLPPPPEEIAKPHLSRAEEKIERAIEEHLQALDNFFADSKKNTPAFVEQALSWRSKGKFLADCVPFTSGTRHSEFLRQQFEEHVFSAKQLEDELQQIVRSYLDHVRSIESEMLVDLRADVSEFPTFYPLAALNYEQLQERYDQALSHAIAASGGALQEDIAGQVVAIIVGELVTVLITKFGTSAAILGTGAASSWTTLGIGLVVGLIVDAIVSKLWDWWADPKGTLAAEIDRQLDEMNRLIVDGAADVKGLRQRLKEFAQERAVHRKTAVLSLLEPSP